MRIQYQLWAKSSKIFTLMSLASRDVMICLQGGGGSEGYRQSQGEAGAAGQK